MTLDDVAAIRAADPKHLRMYHWSYIKRLCDALEAAWAERDRLKNRAVGDANEARHLRQRLGQERERALRAEAVAMDHWKKALELTDALARVRALCDAEPSDAHPVTVRRVRAAIDGP